MSLFRNLLIQKQSARHDTPFQFALTIDTAKLGGLVWTYPLASLDVDETLQNAWIDWGDGNETRDLFTLLSSGQPVTHTYPAEGPYQVRFNHSINRGPSLANPTASVTDLSRRASVSIDTPFLYLGTETVTTC